jgi:hypothetical protein
MTDTVKNDCYFIKAKKHRVADTAIEVNVGGQALTTRPAA